MPGASHDAGASSLHSSRKVLTQKQREFYFENGYILLEKFLPDSWIERLRTATDEMVDKSRDGHQIRRGLGPRQGHTRENPRLRRLSSMNDHHPAYWEYASGEKSPLPDAIADLVGPDVKFHQSKLNFKWSKGGDEVKWHQDISFWPHTNYSPCTAGTYVYDCNAEQGPLGVLPGSHNGPVVDQYNDKGQWVGCLKPEDAAAIDMSKVVYLEGPAGSITIHNCRTLHYSKANWSEIAAAAAAQRLFRGGRDAVYLQSAAVAALRRDRARQAGALGVSRSAPMPAAARLVRRLHVDLRRAAGRGLEQGAAQGRRRRHDVRARRLVGRRRQMITERQKEFRQEYRSRIMGWYDGYLHIVIIYAMGAAAFYIYVQHIDNVTPLEWLTVPLTFLFTNLFEWAVHKYVMHRPVNIKGLRAIYERHTLNHHQFFTDEEMRFRDHKDWRVTVFPPYALVVFILMSLPAARRPRLAALAECRLAVHVHDDRHVSDLRVHALLLPRRRELVRAQLSRS